MMLGSKKRRPSDKMLGNILFIHSKPYTLFISDSVY